MVKYITLFTLLVFANNSWAQLHPQGHQHLEEVLNYESNLEDSYPVFLAIPKGLDEEEPLHFYQYSEGNIARLSTYYYRAEDSLITKTLHQWSNFDDMFRPNKPWRKEDLTKLREKYSDLQLELSHFFDAEPHVFKDNSVNSNIHSEATKWQVPLLYDPILEYRDMEREKDAYGVITLAYVNQIWEETVITQLDFLQHYFLSKIKDKEYTSAISFLSPDLQKDVKEEHMEELESVLSKYNPVLFNSKDGFSNLEREHIFSYTLVDEEATPHYSMSIAFNNNQDIIFLQYRPIQ